MSEYLEHHGIKNQRWYHRRFQNADGSLTPAGKERYGEWKPGQYKKTKLNVVRDNDGRKKYKIESEDGTSVGDITTTHQSDDALRVNWISVNKDHKREGYASSAMNTLIQDAKDSGYKKVTVVIPTDSKDVQHIYERLGFTASKEGLTTDEIADSITSLGDVVKLEYSLEHSDFLEHYGVGPENNGKEVKVYELNKASAELDHWVDKLLDEVKHEDELGEYLEHYGVGPDDNPPGRGSGRYAKGTGERPFQHDPAMQDTFNRRRKKWGIFERIKQRKEKAAAEHAEAAKKREEERQLKEAKDKAEALKKKRLDALNKARATKKANADKAAAEKAAREKHEAEKKAAVDSGDPERIAKYLKELTNQEQIDAINRINNTSIVQDLIGKQQKKRAEEKAAAEKAAKERYEAEKLEAFKSGDTEKLAQYSKAEIRELKREKALTTIQNASASLDKLRDSGEKIVKFYNLAASVNNTFNDKVKLPKIDLGTNQKKDDKSGDKKDKQDGDKKDKQNGGGGKGGDTYNTYNTYNTNDSHNTNNTYNDYRWTNFTEWFYNAYNARPEQQKWKTYQTQGQILLEDFSKRKK